MKFVTYTFVFEAGEITTTALTYEAAKILAQAEAIKNCWDYTTIINAYKVR